VYISLKRPSENLSIRRWRVPTRFRALMCVLYLSDDQALLFVL